MMANKTSIDTDPYLAVNYSQIDSTHAALKLTREEQKVSYLLNVVSCGFLRNLDHNRAAASRALAGEQGSQLTLLSCDE